ncbi:hypothetical protein R6Q59_029270 [Mikania micrantha]
MKISSLVVLCALMMVLQADNIEKTNAQQAYNPTTWSACRMPIKYGINPSAYCCNMLRALQPIYCEFIRNHPYFELYIITSPNFPKVASACGVTIPNNCTLN